MTCVYLGKPQPGKKTPDGRQVHNCRIHTFCVTEGAPSPLASCARCKNRLTVDDTNLKTVYQDPLIIQDREGTATTALRNLLSGRPSFLVCGGPSARSLPLQQLNQRGVWSIAVNNMAGHHQFQPSAFTCADPPLKFHHGIWLDPTVMKFVPSAKFSGRRSKLKQKVGEVFEELTVDGKKVSVTDCPNTWRFGRQSHITPDDQFFLSDHAAWGNNDAGTKQTGGKKTVMTMLLALRLLYYLGSRTIYLVGVDFKMDPTAGQFSNYAFGQSRDPGACDSNNAQFAVANEWLCEMQRNGTFSRFGLEVYNCNQQSGLRAFEHVPFDLAIADTLKNFPKEPFDLEGWYEKK